MNAQTKVTPDPLDYIKGVFRNLGEADQLRLIDALTAEMLEPGWFTQALQDAAATHADLVCADEDAADSYADSIVPQSNLRSAWERHDEKRDGALRYAMRDLARPAESYVPASVGGV